MATAESVYCNTLLAMTTTTSTPARPVVGILFAIAGLLGVLSRIFALSGIVFGGVWFDVVLHGALALGFLLLFLGKGPGMLTRLFYIIAAVGWALLTLSGAGLSLGIVYQIGVVLALVGTLIAGILSFGGKVFSRGANIVFLIWSILAAVVLLNQLVGFLSGTIATVVVAVYAVALLVAGILITARR